MRLNDLKEIEKAAYPEFMQQLQDCQSWADVAEYSECSPQRLLILGVPNQWYAIIALHRRGRAEFVDLAKIPSTEKINWRSLVEELRARGVRRVELDARETTSYHLILTYAIKLKLRIVVDEAWDWDGETMHSMVLDIQKKGE